MSNNRTVSAEVPGQCATGMYQIGIVDGKTHKVKYMSPWRHNLILNSGMYAVATSTWMTCCRYCYLGGGSTTPNYTDSSTDTASSDASGNVTSIGANINFTTFANGDCILFDDGTQGRITSRPTANTCTIVPAPGGGGIASQEFTVLVTSRTQLTGTVLKKVTSYLAGNPNQLVNVQHNATTSVITNRQTYDFTAEVAPATYNEIGVTWSNVTPPASPVLFSRIVLAAPLVLAAGEYARVVYQLSVTISPTNIVAATPDFDNDGTPETWDGSGKLYNLGLSCVNVGNTTVGTLNENFYTTNDSYSNEPCMVGNYVNTQIGANGEYLMWLSYVAGSHSGAYPNLGTAWTTNYITPTLLTASTENLYAIGLTYSQNKVAKWAIGQANTNTIKAFGIGCSQPSRSPAYIPTAQAGFVYIYDTPHTKLSTQTLTLRIKYSWSRTLTID